jgi:hypothetical protein
LTIGKLCGAAAHGMGLWTGVTPFSLGQTGDRAVPVEMTAGGREQVRLALLHPAEEQILECPRQRFRPRSG